MRILNLTFLAAILVSSSCGPRPEKQVVPNQVDLSKVNPPARILHKPTLQKALWMVTTNYTSGGALARLDLTSGALESKVQVTGPDALVFQDGDSGLMLLNRMQNDSITLLSGAKAAATQSLKLVDRSNPQWAARDSANRIWVTSLDSNSVQILSEDLKSQISSIDLSSLKEDASPDGYAELSQVIAADQDHMAIGAQRIHRTSSGWPPDAKAGMALINVHTLQVEATSLLSAPNPILMFPSLSALTSDLQIFMVGSGDLGSAQGVSAAISVYSVNQKAEISKANYPYRILAASFTSVDEPLGVIAWYPTQNQSCVQLGEQKLVCAGSAADGGYVFNKIVRYGNTLFVSYVASGSAQLWLVPIDGSTIQKVNVAMPIESLSFGP